LPLHDKWQIRPAIPHSAMALTVADGTFGDGKRLLGFG